MITDGLFEYFNKDHENRPIPLKASQPLLRNVNPTNKRTSTRVNFQMKLISLGWSKKCYFMNFSKICSNFSPQTEMLG